MEISQLLKENRNRHELTQEQLSKKIFVSKKTISNWETGKTTPDIDSLIRLAQLFEFSLDDLLLRESNLVRNIKIQAELKVTKIYLLILLVTDILFCLIIITQGIFGNLSRPAQMMIMLGTVTNTCGMFYFWSKIWKLQENSLGLGEMHRKRLFFTIIIGIILYALFFYTISLQ